jgi:hypothetical protein
MSTDRTDHDLLIGIAVDVSYSMKSSIRNDTNEQFSRFSSLHNAFKKLAEETKKATEQNPENKVTAPVNVFLYIYGLQDAENSSFIIDSGVCDYLSLVKVAKTLRNTTASNIRETQEYRELREIAYQNGLEKVLEDDEVLNAMQINKKATRNMITRLKNEEQSRKELAEYIKKAYGAQDASKKIGIGGAIAAVGLGIFTGGLGAVPVLAGLGAAAGASAAAWDAKTKKDEAIKLVKRLSRSLDGSEESAFEYGLDDTTLSLNEALRLINDEAQTDQIEDFIYGNTPMREAFSQISERWVREARKGNHDIADKILFVISDGESTDGDPSFYASNLKEKGVTIISCYITDRDLMDPRILPSKINDEWPDGAKLMFDISSPVSPDSRVSRFLMEKHWDLTKSSKYFAQLNHSDVLEELIRSVLSPFQQSSNLLPRGM